MVRLRVVLLVFYLWLFFIVFKLFYWQILSHEDLSLAADKQHLMQVILPAGRGEITTSDGSLLVGNQMKYQVHADPKKILGNPLNIKNLAQLLGMDESSVSAKLNPDLVWVSLKRRIDKETVDAIKSLKLDGLGFEDEEVRFYLEGSMSAHLLGFVGYSYDGTSQGYFGLEGYYDRMLKGKAGFLRQAKDAMGNPILAGNQKRVSTQDGRTLKLHLDKTIQFVVEKKLEEGVQKYGAKGGSIVVMRPKDGGILAMASLPSYDPGSYADFSSDYYKNPVVAETYEPGSTFKPVVMAAALNEGLVGPDTVFDEPGPVEVGGYTIRTWNDKYSGTITATQILEKSSNVGMVQVGRKLGKEKLLSYIKKFGFGQETGVDLQEETNPLLRPDDGWKEIDLATTTFGQGIAVTPMQMVGAMAAIANGGRLMEPQVVDAIIDKNGKKIDIEPKVVNEVISPATARILTNMLVSSVDKSEAKFAKLKGYRIAGKTGTAQIPVAGHYDTQKTIASFIGFAPADEPKFVMLVTLQEPTSSPWGSETAAPLFFSIAKDLLAYYNIPPTEQ